MNTPILDDLELCIDRVIARVGRCIVLAAPLGLGKPVQLMNAFYARAQRDPTLDLHIYTALSLEVPVPGSEIEAGFARPILKRLFGDYEGLRYLSDLRSGTLPDNVRVTEMYFKAGSMKGVPVAQQAYVSSNYTHIARDLCDLGVNVLCQLLAFREQGDSLRLSLSCNPDTSLDLLKMLRRERPGDFVTVGQLHPDLPFMHHDAEVAPGDFDLLLRNAAWNRRLFAVPNAPVPETDYATALHASSLVVDGGTLQIGIGSLGDAVAQALIVRHEHNHAYRQLIAQMSPLDHTAGRSFESFEKGLYLSTEMFVNGMLRLMEHGVVKRRVYDDLALQEGLNRGEISERVDERLFAYGRRSALIPRVLDPASTERLRHFGIVGARVMAKGEVIQVDGTRYPNDCDDPDLRAALIASVEGGCLRNGRILHGGFFLGPRDFYDRLRALSDSDHEQLCMTSVLRTNQLLQDPALYSAQRRDARFINTGMMVSLSGAVASDALENGTIISGVGGQYNFVSMAHDLPGARSVLCIRATRGAGRDAVSNIVPFYGHTTIPRHLRDIVVTEYGIADLRGQSDAEVIKRLLLIADSRFQESLLIFAKEQGKLEPEYRIPAAYCHNTPDRLGEVLQGAHARGLLPVYPFGTELTQRELELAASLRRIKALSEEPAHFISRAFRALLHHADADAARPYLEAIHLEHPHTSREFLVQQLLLLDLEERGLLRVS